MIFEQRKVECLLEAVTPVAHHQESIGNSAVIFRRKVRQPGGGWASVPYITGDSIRHQLREAIVYATLGAAGLLDSPKLSEGALRFMFSGGMLTERGEASVIKLDHYREMVEVLPFVALLGGCANSRVIPGRLSVNDALLVCRESAALIPAEVLEHAGTLDTCRAHVELTQRVRMDPTLDPSKRELLSDEARTSISRRADASEAAHDADNAVARESSKSTMLPRTHEQIAAGSLFYWSVNATCYSSTDVDTFDTMVGAFLARAVVGGKRGTGHGALRCVRVTGGPGDGCEARFVEHVAARSDRVKRFLGEVSA